MEKEKKQKGRAWKIFKESVKAIFQGELLLRLKFDKYIAHIVVVGIAMMVVLLARCAVENQLVKRARLKNELQEASLMYAQKNIELVGLGRMSTVEELLQENNVNVGTPDKPATIIKK